MRLTSLSVPVLLTAAGTLYFSAVVFLVTGEVRLGTPAFLAVAAVMGIAYGLIIGRVWSGPQAPRRMLLTAFALAVVFRMPAALAYVGPDSDMVRYIWDGRVQRLGYNPYLVVPADPRLAHTHDEQTAAMPSARERTPYLPAAQLFFRLIVSIRGSTIGMKLSLVACDLLTMLVVWRWLIVTGKNEWLTLAYAWHPLVVLEVAHSGHIDALGALWMAATAYWMARGRTTLATVAFVLAIATKPLPIVLVPLLAGRVRRRDVLMGAALAAALYLPFMSGTELPLGAVPGVVAHNRFNGPVFQAIAWLTMPAVAAAVAICLGMAVAIWARKRLPPSDPIAWAWPMAVALLCAPVVYPWYLLYLTPFLFTRSALPITVWTFSVLPVYIVWETAAAGGQWTVPPALMALEYGVVAIAGFVVLNKVRAGGPGKDEPE